MKKANFTITFDEEKLEAVKRFMLKKGTDLETELTAQLVKLYEKYVPASVREYIDDGLEEDKPLKKAPLRSTASPPKHPELPKTTE